jgi:hypothetical protein
MGREESASGTSRKSKLVERSICFAYSSSVRDSATTKKSSTCVCVCVCVFVCVCVYVYVCVCVCVEER